MQGGIVCKILRILGLILQPFALNPLFFLEEINSLRAEQGNSSLRRTLKSGLGHFD